MNAAPSRRLYALSAALALPLAVLSAAPATAATVGVTTWSELKAAFLVDGDTVRLDANITADSLDSLTIQPGESIVIDLNGFALTITAPSPSAAAIAVPPTSSLTINATNGGTLTATGGDEAAGIGGGESGTGGTTTINGGTITATGRFGAAGIGGGVLGDGGTTTINGGTITARGGGQAAGIGGGNLGDGGTTTINGGTTTAIGGARAAGIGGGLGRDGGTTTINGGTTTATGGSFGAGIGGGSGGYGGTTTINGGSTTATGGSFGAGIGGGYLGIVGVLQVNGTPDPGAATNGGGSPVASPISNSTLPAGVGYSATTSTVSDGGRIVLRFSYLITFAANGGSTTASPTINDGDTLTEPPPPTREGFTFAGWEVGGSAYDFTTPVTEPLTLTATWTAVLAATGADVTTTLGIATLLLTAGGSLIALRRRATTRPE